MTEYLDRYPTMHEYAEGKRINPELTDLISRADAIEALCHNCAYYTDAQCKTDSGYWCESGAMIREDIPSAELPNGDMISRADAIEAACNEMDWLDDGCVEERKTMIKDALSALPSADAEYADFPDVPRYYYEKVVGKMAHEINMLKEQLESAEAVQGEWHQISPARIYECSICNHNVLTDYIDTYNYCPNCGARMKGGDTE